MTEARKYSELKIKNKQIHNIRAQHFIDKYRSELFLIKNPNNCLVKVVQAYK